MKAVCAVEMLRQEFDLAMAGCPSLTAITRDLVRPIEQVAALMTERRTDSSPSSRVSTPKLPQKTNSRFAFGCET